MVHYLWLSSPIHWKSTLGAYRNARRAAFRFYPRLSPLIHWKCASRSVLAFSKSGVRRYARLSPPIHWKYTSGCLAASSVRGVSLRLVMRVRDTQAASSSGVEGVIPSQQGRVGISSTSRFGVVGDALHGVCLPKPISAIHTSDFDRSSACHRTE